MIVVSRESKKTDTLSLSLPVSLSPSCINNAWYAMGLSKGYREQNLRDDWPEAKGKHPAATTYNNNASDSHDEDKGYEKDHVE